MDHDLTPEQQADAQRLAELLQGIFAQELRNITRLLASKDDRHLLGQTEFQLRDLVQRLAAKALETALNQRKKGGIRAPA